MLLRGSGHGQFSGAANPNSHPNEYAAFYQYAGDADYGDAVSIVYAFFNRAASHHHADPNSNLYPQHYPNRHSDADCDRNSQPHRLGIANAHAEFYTLGNQNQNDGANRNANDLSNANQIADCANQHAQNANPNTGYSLSYCAVE